jgi:TolB-like protein/DNA-binding winged helix-turn-helix (wHTH) protein/cytochrome c-type biogenesis protein CcmH/NrfG
VGLVGDTAFRIGQWRVDPAVDEISRDGTTVKLEPRTMRLLMCLAERAGAVVSVNELLDTVWKDLVVTQSSVYQAIAVLRRALGDDPKRPVYIASVARRGYRLILPVEVEEQGQHLAAVPDEPPQAAGSQAGGASVADEDHPASLEPPDVGEGIERGGAWRHWPIWAAALGLAAVVGWLFLRPNLERMTGASAVHAPATTTQVDGSSAVFTPPPHSVAVLPFSNLSGDPKQEYFSDGITEELINALAQVDALKVIARTSSFQFKDKDADIGTIARKLNVAAILEGSVRRSGNQVRVTAQLIDAVNGFHIWSQDYDRDLNNVLLLQTDIATRVAHELQAKLLGDEAPKIELGGTRNAAAFDAYLRGSRAHISGQNAHDAQAAITAYSEAIRLDPQYALAYAGRSNAYTSYAEEYASGAAVREALDEALADARKAIALAPELAEGHAALGHFFESGARDFARANEAYERALALAPGNVQVLRGSADFAISMGHIDAGIAAARRGVTLDPLNPRSYFLLGQGLYAARRYDEAVSAFTEAISLDPGYRELYGIRGLAYYGLGNLQSARSSCETNADHWVSQWCLAVVYQKLGRPSDAEAVLAKYRATEGDGAAYQYAAIYAQWGDRAKALQWLETAARLHDSGLIYLKTDPLLDPLRSEPRFQAIERELKFPSN